MPTRDIRSRRWLDILGSAVGSAKTGAAAGGGPVGGAALLLMLGKVCFVAWQGGICWGPLVFVFGFMWAVSFGLVVALTAALAGGLAGFLGGLMDRLCQPFALVLLLSAAVGAGLGLGVWFGLDFLGQSANTELWLFRITAEAMKWLPEGTAPLVCAAATAFAAAMGAWSSRQDQLAVREVEAATAPGQDDL